MPDEPGDEPSGGTPLAFDPDDESAAGAQPSPEPREESAGGTHSALKRHRTTPNPAGAKKQTSSSDTERTSDDPPVAQTEPN